MRSSKPKAKEFKKAVKHILKEIRLKGYYMAGELAETESPQKTLTDMSDLTYIKNKIAEVQVMDNLADISAGLERVQRLVDVIGGTP